MEYLSAIGRVRIEMARVESGSLEGGIDGLRVLDIAVKDDGLAAECVLLVCVNGGIDVLRILVSCCHLCLVELTSLHLELCAVHYLSR